MNFIIKNWSDGRVIQVHFSGMARKKIREYDSKRILKEFLKKLAGIELGIKSAQVLCLHSRIRLYYE